MQKAENNTYTNSVAVVIPVYLPVIDGPDLLSLSYALKKLEPKRDVYFVCPKSLETEFYSNLAPNAKFVTFDDCHFQSIATYSQLLLNCFFYEKFNAYEFMLICQTDAIIVQDELDYWCNQEYDYIGAPWPKDIERKVTLNGQEFHFYVGNGGLSLRRINKCIQLLNDFSEDIVVLSNKIQINEDSFFALFGTLSKNFNIPNELIASKFSLEWEPDYFYKQNGNHLPVGGHNWWKSDIKFWTNILNSDPDFVQIFKLCCTKSGLNLKMKENNSSI
jgi:hypothetical protein